MTKILTSFLLLFFLFSVAPAYAGGAAARSKQQRMRGQQQQQMMQQRAMQERQRQQELVQQEPIDESEIQEIDITQLWQSLDQSGEAWALMIDNEAKVYAVSHYIENYRKAGIAIHKPPQFYVQAIDSMSAQDPKMLSNSFPNILRVVAIIEYDFDNGQNKHQMARQVLGEEGFRDNLRRLGAPQ